jgi:hypothetical protein
MKSVVYARLPQQKWEKWDSDKHARGTEHAGIADALPSYKGWDIDQPSQVLHPTRMQQGQGRTVKEHLLDSLASADAIPFEIARRDIDDGRRMRYILVTVDSVGRLEKNSVNNE